MTKRRGKKTPELLDEIVERISNGETLRAICREEGKPSWVNVYQWMREDENFALRIARARELGADAIAEEIIYIIDDCTDDVIFLAADDANGAGAKPAIKHSAIKRASLRAEMRLKLLAKWQPKKYGNSVDINATIRKPELNDNDEEIIKMYAATQHGEGDTSKS